MKRVLLSLVLLAGCSHPDVVHLGPEWRPLEEIRCDKTVEKNVYRTSVPYVYTHDLDNWYGAPYWAQRALLLHEQLHARHELALGPDAFRYQYEHDVGFRFREESAAWDLQIREYVRHDYVPNPYQIAEFLATHYDGAFGYDWSLNWVLQEIDDARSGR